MKVLFVTKGQDNANVGYNMMKAAEAVGCEVRGYSQRVHPFKYPHHLPVTSRGHSGDVGWADVIHYYKSLSPFDPVPDKPSVIQHGDDALRTNKIEILDMYQHLKKRTHIYETADLAKHLVDETSYFLPPPVDTSLLEPCTRKGKIKVGHFPSMPSNKGSDTIISVVKQLHQTLDFESVIPTNHIVSWEENLQRLAQVDICIDQHSIVRNPSVGEPGMITREAAALGVVPVTNSFNIGTYRRNYGQHGFLTANSYDEFYTILYGLISMGRQKVEALGQFARKWVVDKHSYVPTGQKLLAIYEGVIG